MLPIHIHSRQTVALTTTPIVVDSLPVGKVTLIVVGCDALVSFGTEPDADVDGGVVAAGMPLVVSANPGDWKASIKAISGSGTATFYTTAS